MIPTVAKNTSIHYIPSLYSTLRPLQPLMQRIMASMLEYQLFGCGGGDGLVVL